MNKICFMMALLFSLAVHAEDRPRLHNIRGSVVDRKSELTAAGSSSSAKHRVIEFQYGYNMGYIMPYGSIEIDKDSDSDGGSTKETMIVVGAQANFIENKPGNNVIPFARLGLVYDRTTMEQSGFLPLKLKSDDGIRIGFGAWWYPFGELVALEIEAFRTTVDFKVTNGTVNTAEIEQNSIQTAWVLSF